MADFPSTSVSDMDDRGLMDVLSSCRGVVRGMVPGKEVTLEFPCIWVRVRPIFTAMLEEEGWRRLGGEWTLACGDLMVALDLSGVDSRVILLMADGRKEGFWPGDGDRVNGPSYGTSYWRRHWGAHYAL